MQRLVTYRDLKAFGIPYTPQHILRLQKQGLFPLRRKLGNFNFYKVPNAGFMTDTNCFNTCTGAGFRVGCQAQVGCQYNDNVCTITSETSCGNPMQGLSYSLCGNGVSPSACAPLYGVYQYMGNAWVGGCGAEQNQWCVQGNNALNKNALCVIQ